MNILIAEDDQHIREGLQELLEQEGYQIYVAKNGITALELYTHNDIDLILLDIMMPELDGFSVCKAIRKHDDHTAILFLTAKSEEIDQVLGLELGADDYIFKPFGTREILARIRAVARRCLNTTDRVDKLIQTPESVTLQDVIFYPQDLKICRNQLCHTLSPRESRILLLFYNNKGRIISRDQLFNEIWGRDYLPNSRTLDQTISKLRKLIEKDHRQPKIIKTVHGLGYRYDE